MISEDLIDELMGAVRVKSSVGRTEVESLVESCLRDMDMAGVYISNPSEPAAKNAIKLYIKGQYGYDKDNDKFMDMYRALKDSMALSGDYPKEAAGNG